MSMRPPASKLAEHVFCVLHTKQVRSYRCLVAHRVLNSFSSYIYEKKGKTTTRTYSTLHIYYTNHSPNHENEDSGDRTLRGKEITSSGNHHCQSQGNNDTGIDNHHIGTTYYTKLNDDDKCQNVVDAHFRRSGRKRQHRAQLQSDVPGDEALNTLLRPKAREFHFLRFSRELEEIIEGSDEESDEEP